METLTQIMPIAYNNQKYNFITADLDDYLQQSFDFLKSPHYLERSDHLYDSEFLEHLFLVNDVMINESSVRKPSFFGKRDNTTLQEPIGKKKTMYIDVNIVSADLSKSISCSYIFYDVVRSDFKQKTIDGLILTHSKSGRVFLRPTLFNGEPYHILEGIVANSSTQYYSKDSALLFKYIPDL